MKTCRICARPSGGIRFGVLCCKGCKEFYRRSTEKGRVFKCYLGGNCSSNYEAILGQRNCKACRYRKCIELGMQRLESPRTPASNDSTIRGREIIQSQHASSHSMGDEFENTAGLPDISRKLSTDDVYPDDKNVPFANIRISGPESDCEYSDRMIMGFNDGGPKNPTTISQWGHFPDEHTVFDNVRVGFLPTYPSFRFNPVIEYETSDFFRLISHCQRNTEQHQDVLAQTIFAVEKAAQMVFSQQVSAWTQFKNAFIRTHGSLPAENKDNSDSALQTMLVVVNRHNRDHSQRVLQFARLLPGMDESGLAARRFYPGRWKWMVFWMIHHAPFTCENENYMILGENNLHYNRYWEDRIFDSNLALFHKQFTRELRDLELTQTESYLLMAVVMFEPGEIVIADILSNDERDPSNPFTNAVHHHYADALLFSIKQGCTTTSQFAEVCSKIGNFFNRLKLASIVHTRYFSYSGGDWPAGFQLLKEMALTTIIENWPTN